MIEKTTNGWSTSTLKEYLLTLITENDRRYSQQFENSTIAVTAALSAAKEAVNKAETATEKRFENVNEFRATLADQQRTLIPRSEIEVIINGIYSRLKVLENANSEIKGTKIGESVVFAYIVGALGIIFAIIGFILKK